MVGSIKDHNIKEKRHRNAHVLLKDGGNVHTLILRVTDIDGTETDCSQTLLIQYANGLALNCSFHIIPRDNVIDYPRIARICLPHTHL